jgi:hypothetical protein
MARRILLGAIGILTLILASCFPVEPSRAVDIHCIDASKYKYLWKLFESNRRYDVIRGASFSRQMRGATKRRKRAIALQVSPPGLKNRIPPCGRVFRHQIICLRPSGQGRTLWVTECGQQQTGIGRDDGPAKLEHYAAVEIEAKNTVVRFAHRARHACPTGNRIAIRTRCLTQAFRSTAPTSSEQRFASGVKLARHTRRA